MSDGESLRQAANAHPGEYTPVGMLADWCDERGWPETAALVREGLYLTPAVFQSGCGGGGYGGYGYGYGGGGYGDGGDGGGGYGDGGYGYGGGYGDGGYGYGGLKVSPGVTLVERGLRIICSPGGYYPYVRIGWCERDDVWVLIHNCVVIRRFGTEAQLATLAKTGPAADTHLLERSELERVCVAACSRVIDNCDPAKWARWCPKPDGW